LLKTLKESEKAFLDTLKGSKSLEQAYDWVKKQMKASIKYLEDPKNKNPDLKVIPLSQKAKAPWVHSVFFTSFATVMYAFNVLKDD
jgi:hypothetical protein